MGLTRVQDFAKVAATDMLTPTMNYTYACREDAFP
jgi:hypothetical protein